MTIKRIFALWTLFMLSMMFFACFGGRPDVLSAIFFLFVWFAGTVALALIRVITRAS